MPDDGDQLTLFPAAGPGPRDLAHLRISPSRPKWATDPHAQPIRCGTISYHPPTPVTLAAIAGHDLACWCPLDQPCHADVLLELTNNETAP